MIDVGSTVGPYEIVSLINRGGMATLFLGRREGPGGFARHVAVKVIHPHLAQDENFVRMFFDEAQLSARIQHPNVVHVEELGESDGDYYLVMEYIHGATLAQLLTKLSEEGRRLTPAQAVMVAMDTADGLHAAHELQDDEGNPLGLVHRDISPQNILVSSNGHVKVIDFGVAKAAGRQQLSVTGALKGKYAYMSPEQARGERVDRRTDIYAVGIVLWETLAMRRLFRGRNEVEVLDKVRNPEVLPPSEHMAGIPPAVDAAVIRALSVDRDARFQTCRELRVALLEAMPEAMAVDESELATVLRAAMGEQLSRKRAVLPTSVPGVESPARMERTVRMNLLHDVTSSAPGAHYGKTEISPAEGAAPDEVVSVVPGVARRGSVAGRSPAATPPVGTAGGRPRRGRVVAVAAVLGVLAAAGGVAAYQWSKARGGAETPPGIRLLQVDRGFSIDEARRRSRDAGPPVATASGPGDASSPGLRPAGDGADRGEGLAGSTRRAGGSPRGEISPAPGPDAGTAAARRPRAHGPHARMHGAGMLRPMVDRMQDTVVPGVPIFDDDF